MKTLSLSLLFLCSFQAQALQGLSTLEQQLAEKNQSLKALSLEIEAKERLLKSSRSAFMPSLEAVGGWSEFKMNDPGDNEKGTFGYLDGKINLYRGFKDMSVHDKKSAEFELAKLDYEQKRRELREELVTVASGIYHLHRLQEILKQEEDITKEQKRLAARKVQAGLTSSVDNLELELREQEIQIQQRQIDQSHREAHHRLQQIFGTDIAEETLDKLEYEKVPALFVIPPAPEKSLESKKAELQLQIAESEKTEAKSDFHPSLDFTYSYGQITPTETSFAQSAESQIGLKLSIPLFSGLNTYQTVKASSAQWLAKSAQVQQSQLNLVASYNSLRDKMKELTELYQINEKKLEISKKYFTMTVEEYKRGIKNSPDLVGATERWFSSQKRKFELLNEIEITKAKIENL